MIKQPMGTEPSSAPTAKRRKTNMKLPVNTSTALGVIDPESDIEGKICVLDDEPYDAMLVFVDPAKNVDKFFVLQLIECESGMYAMYSRWGRTGTSGQGLEQEFDEFEDALQCFEDKFKEKTGLDWKNRHKPVIGSKYRFIQQNFQAKREGYVGAKWQYWVDDGVDGKVPGWYDYSPTGSIQVEQLYQENTVNPILTNRLVHSGHFLYAVDLALMTQTNVQHPNRTSRRIRRFVVPSAQPSIAGSHPYVKAEEGSDFEEDADVEEDADEDVNLPKRNFVLTVTADISGKGGEGNTTLGSYFEEDYDGFEMVGTGMDTSLRGCLQADETTFRRACGEVVLSYITDNAKEIFDTITNLEYVDKDLGIVFTGPARVDRTTGKISLPFRETVPREGEDSDQLHTDILSEINIGGDTWDCGDFGDINQRNVNANDWNYWLGTSRRCLVELPNNTDVKIRAYFGINPEITEQI